MKKKSIFFGVMFIFVLTASLFAASGIKKGPENITLESKTGNVPFPHRLHQDSVVKKEPEDCNICHSLFPQKAGSIKALMAEGKLKSKEVMNENCTKCHKEKKRAGEKSGPTTCKTCHSLK
jgi:hypothetical protein